MMPVIVQL
jgi:hypothetical protein